MIPCAGTGQDGDVQAGAPLAYVDNGDGTITDLNTSLTWEKLSDDGSIHDKDTTYTWDNAFAVHVAGLNNHCANDLTVPCSGDGDCTAVSGVCGFAGHREWRVPNYKELVSILNLQNVSPSVSAAFNNNCTAGCTVLSCSCTAGIYWSSTTEAGSGFSAFLVRFDGGNVVVASKSGNFLVRAVRGGS